ncbi:nuclear pore complex protein-like protein Nup107 [Zopfia rhizophila CBS 207.26]|uniref:Nuclear pore complex protein n=1 Tax=Zopfia rhizophila CBS 207.26 TaxID=1314779 RepID=A0A6A6EAM4_9PEZI|nr:nuclear pore complex protein-like protein Nup107 [Zopfia rhizophila CBS 207.26]
MNAMAATRGPESPLTLVPNSQEDPLQPLRTMAERVGKEVEKFAERVDHWHTHGNEDQRAKYHTTLRMVGKFKDLADSRVKELKEKSGVENRGELAKSVQWMIQNMADSPHPSIENDLGKPFQPVIPSVEPSSSNIQELRQWQAESATWDLLRIIIELYHPEPGLDVMAAKRARLAKVGGAYRYSPNSEIWERFLLEDDQAKEKLLILRWLEKTAESNESDIQSITEQLEAQSGKDTSTWTSGWLDSKSKIKQEKRLRGSDQPLDADISRLRNGDRTQLLVTQLDPDAPTRQRRHLEKSDDYYERALWMVLYEMMRRGTPWEQVCEWCKDKNESWRGISIGAAYESPPDGGPNVSGPNVGYLFRRMCFYAARGARYEYERALYGLLGGDLKSVEPACRSWDDHLYARYNALLLSRFDGYLQRNYPQKVPSTLARKFVFQDAVAAIGDWENSASQVIDHLKQQKSTAAQALSPIKLIQGSLITRNIEGLIYNVGVAISMMLREDKRSVNLIIDPNSDPKTPTAEFLNPRSEATAEKYYQTLAMDPHAFRILVHVFIVLRNGLGLLKQMEFDQWAAVDNVIAAYIEFLRISQRVDLIPLYAAQLHPERQTHCLGRILPDIRHPQEQKRCINLMQQYGIDVSQAIAQNYQCVLEASGLLSTRDPIKRYEMLEPTGEDEWLWPGQRIKKSFSGLEIESKEEAVIDCLLWYNHLERERSAMFVNLTDAMKHFLLNGRLGAAIKLTEEMNLESISLHKTKQYCGYSFDFTIPGTEEQDTSVIARSMRSSTKRGSTGTQSFPSAEEHMHHVIRFRQLSKSYYELQQLVRVINLLREWREEEINIIKARTEGVKPATKRIKDIFDTIDSTLEALLFDHGEDLSSNFLDHDSEGRLLNLREQLPDSDRTKSRMDNEYKEFDSLKCAYIPELTLSYISVVQACSCFLNRETAVKAMEVANQVADEVNWDLKDTFLKTGRMEELVDMLANVGRGMLALGEVGDKKKTSKKRGWKGESLRIWDLNVKN